MLLLSVGPFHEITNKVWDKMSKYWDNEKTGKLEQFLREVYRSLSEQ